MRRTPRAIRVVGEKRLAGSERIACDRSALVCVTSTRARVGALACAGPATISVAAAASRSVRIVRR